MPPPLPRCSSRVSSSLISPRRISLPRKGHRVGLHIVLFEACSAFTRVAACTLARSPICDPLSEGFRHFVSSMPAPVASGWSESPGGACTHWKAPPYHGAPPKGPFTSTAAIGEVGRSADIQSRCWSPQNRLRSPERIKCEQLLRPFDAAQGIATYRDQPASFQSRRGSRESLRQQHVAFHRSAHRGNPGDLVDRRANYGEVEPFVTPDIAVEHLAYMKADIYIRCRQAVVRSALVKSGNPFLQAVMSGDCAAAGFFGRRRGEDRQGAVADQL